MSTSRAWKRYAVAVALVVLAVLLSALLMQRLGPWFGNVFFLAVLLSAWYGGRGPGLVTAALTVAVGIAFTVLAGRPFTLAQVLGFIAFAAGALVITGLVDGLRVA